MESVCLFWIAISANSYVNPLLQAAGQTVWWNKMFYQLDQPWRKQKKYRQTMTTMIMVMILFDNSFLRVSSRSNSIQIFIQFWFFCALFIVVVFPHWKKTTIIPRVNVYDLADFEWKDARIGMSRWKVRWTCVLLYIYRSSNDEPKSQPATIIINHEICSLRKWHENWFHLHYIGWRLAYSNRFIWLAANATGKIIYRLNLIVSHQPNIPRSRML